MKKKLLCLWLAIAMSFCLLPAAALADAADAATVYVTISKYGELVDDEEGDPVAMVPITLSGQEAYTMDDALKAAHEAYFHGDEVLYAGGATPEDEADDIFSEDGYYSYDGDYGLSLGVLWGEDSGSFGYQLNSGAKSVTSLAQEVKDGDCVEAFIYENSYPDTETYAVFAPTTAVIKAGGTLELTLRQAGYDTDWSMVFSPCADATLTVNGKAGAVTDADGTARLTFDEAGVYVVSAVKSKTVADKAVTAITAPVCLVTVVEPATVKVRAQQGASFLYTGESLSVDYGTAAAYGFENASGLEAGTITALDVLAAAHADQYGESFSAAPGDFLTMSSGNPGEMFGNGNTGDTAKYSGFAVNHSYPMDGDGNGYSVYSCPVADGDVVDFFYYEDSCWGDYLSWFSDGEGQALDSLRLDVGEAAALYLKGFMYMSGYSDPTPEPLYDGEGALSLYLTGESDPLQAIKANTGAVTVSFATAGAYTLTARGSYNDFRVVPPYLPVRVGANQAGGLAIAGYTLTPDFNASTYAYALAAELPATGSSVKAKLTFPDGATAKYSYKDLNNAAKTAALTSGREASLSNIKAGRTQIDFIVTDADKNSKTYALTLQRLPGLSKLTALAGNGDSLGVSFNAATYDYSAALAVGDKLVFTPTFNETKNTRLWVTIDGDGATTAEYAADGYTVAAGEHSYALQTKSADGSTSGATYTFTVTGVARADSSLTVPAGAQLTVFDSLGNAQEAGPATGSAEGTDTYTLSLLSGKSYTYAVGLYGYQSVGGGFKGGSSFSIGLTKLAAPSGGGAAAFWPCFRQNGSNMAVLEADAPTTADETELLWTQIASSATTWGYLPASYIVADGNIVAAGGTKLSLLDADDGTELKTVTMAGSRGYAYMSPLYADGKLFVALEGGLVQAFDAKTLDSLWLYTDPYGGQPLSCLTYDAGYVYTGFGGGGKGAYNFVCLNATDENSGETLEAKTATWTYTAKNDNFYWSGAYISGDYLVVGSDAALRCFNKQTGAVTDNETVDGEIRSAIAASDGKLYFTTKKGSLYQTSLDGDGKFGALRKAALSGASTSTPVVYDGYAFVGTEAKSVDMVRLSDMEKAAAYTAPAACKSSALLIPDAANSRAYLYMTYNAKPGGLLCLTADLTKGTLSGTEIFTPATDKQQFCIANVICDADGRLYYANDSGNIFALGQLDTTPATVAQVIALINSVGTVDENSAEEIKAARRAYERLSAAEQAQVNNSATLIASESAYARLLEAARDGALEALEDAYNSYDEDDYTSSAWSKLKKVYREAQSDINSAAACDEADEALAAGKKAMKAVSRYDMTVSFRLIGDWRHEDGARGHDEYLTWIKTADYELAADSTVYDLLLLALDEAELSQRGASNNYVGSIKAPSEFGGYWLAEFDNGPDSGWMYTVNGKHAKVGLKDCELEDGDKVVWHYVDDYDAEEDDADWLEAEDISPAQYIKKYGDTSLILNLGAGGSVSPSGRELGDYLGKKVTFTFTPEAGYRIKEVTVDGKSQGAVSSYTYKNLTVDSRIKVAFEQVQQTAGFPDVTAAHWAYSYINSLAARGVAGGYPNGCFYPDATVTRADFVVMLARLSGEGLPAYSGQFNDVSADKYYAQAVAWAAAAGVTAGDGQGGFLPEALISRQDMAAMLHRYASHMRIALPTGNAARFSDGAKIANYALPAVNAMYQANVVGGYPDGSVKPGGSATRAEAVKMMYLLDSYK